MSSELSVDTHTLGGGTTWGLVPAGVSLSRVSLCLRLTAFSCLLCSLLFVVVVT